MKSVHAILGFFLLAITFKCFVESTIRILPVDLEHYIRKECLVKFPTNITKMNECIETRILKAMVQNKQIKKDKKIKKVKKDKKNKKSVSSESSSDRSYSHKKNKKHLAETTTVTTTTPEKENPQFFKKIGCMVKANAKFIYCKFSSKKTDDECSIEKKKFLDECIKVKHLKEALRILESQPVHDLSWCQSKCSFKKVICSSKNLYKNPKVDCEAQKKVCDSLCK